MINLIYGGKGSGKTTEIINLANENLKTAKGFHVYIDKNAARMHDLDHEVKLVDAGEYSIDSEIKFLAFIKGIVAANYDIEKIYIDNIDKITGLHLLNTKELFAGLDKISSQAGVGFVITVPAEKDNMPEFLQKYI